MSSLYLIGFVQTVFFSLLVLTKKDLRLSDKFLSAFILIMGLRLFGIYFLKLGFYDTHPKLLLIKYLYWPLLGPMLYLYICAITSKSQKFKPIYLIHFIPAFLVLIAILTYIIIGNYQYFHEFSYPGIVYNTGMFVWFFISYFYFSISIYKLHQFKKEIKHFFAYTKNIDLNWLLNLSYGFGLFLLCSLFFILAKEVFDIDIFGFFEHITWAIITLYIFGIGFYGYKQRMIFSYSDELAKEIEQIYEKPTGQQYTKPSTQYAKTRIDEVEKKEILESLLKYMENEKPYLNSELNLQLLSEQINTSLYKLSQVINTNFNKNFFEFVNEYRIEEAKNYLKDPKFAQEKIMNIAYVCGFNSKSSFFSVFKKTTSQTPAEYKRMHLTA